MTTHSFETDIARVVGVNAAVVYQNIVFWTRKNFANGKHVIDGRVWTYNSVKAWGELFEYLTANQIRTALEKLEAAGLITAGNFNERAYDRTKWYGVPVEIHLGKNANGFAGNHEPIPDSKPDIKPDTTETPAAKARDEIEKAFEAFNSMAKSAGWPICRGINEQRTKAMGARLKECGGLSGWADALKTAAASDFLCGRKTDFRANIDFLLQKSSFTKLIEGNYNRGGAGAQIAIRTEPEDPHAETVMLVQRGHANATTAHKIRLAHAAGRLTDDEARAAGVQV